MYSRNEHAFKLGLCLCLTLLAGRVCCQSENPSFLPFFQSRYITLGYGKSFPEQESVNTFDAASGDPYVGFQYIYDDKWMVGMRFGFTSLYDKTSSQNLNLLRLSQESLRLFRLSYPYFLAVGGSLMYMEPSRGITIPPTKQHVYKRETGVSLIVSLLYIFNKRVILSARLEKWRGVDSDDFAAIEPTFNILYSLP